MKNLKMTMAVLLTAGIGSLQAAAIIGFGDPLLDAALLGGTQEDFDAATPGEYSTATFGDLTVSGVDAPFTIGSDFVNGYNTSGINSVYNGTDEIPKTFRFDFATPVDAFAFNFGASDNVWTISAFDASDSVIETYNMPILAFSNSGEYFGIAAAGISYATVHDTGNVFAFGDYVLIDRFTYNSDTLPPPPPPPPPSVPDGGTTVLLLAISLFALRLFASKEA